MVPMLIYNTASVILDQNKLTNAHVIVNHSPHIYPADTLESKIALGAGKVFLSVADLKMMVLHADANALL